MPNPRTLEYAQQITCIDTFYQRQGLAACYLLESEGEAAFIDTGTSNSVPQLMAVLEQKGISPSQVRYVIPTHVHLDHAGGAGSLMSQLPNASLVIHPYGAKHLIDPSKLIAGATAVYGEEAFEKQFGQLIPIPEERVIQAPDGFRCHFGNRELLCLDTPGHARHHICIFDEQSRGLFTGDTFGLSYPELSGTQGPFIVPTTTPIQLDPDAWYETLDRLMELKPEKLYLTHFGEVSEPEKLVGQLRQHLQEFTTIALAAVEEPGEQRKSEIERALQKWLLQKLEQNGNTLAADKSLELMAMDLDLDAQGIEVWLARREEAAAG
ncbi:MAG: MBL fold metallo-hydrolase [Candidatus Thiodiazotropha weberae]|uniref:MBL fold metallo-hydrolase n=1 Tax=Candidatus Thiodiazotropha endoloripes TaxID=1818881 RepID=A0A1E2UIU3_9GAMM|nr:MBL fold metallo-hydrolase [Candidatus Thiodiazotropha endoloripes]MCG7897660.1 MBL fold metallo-hydrolase [Candidatus Thiodiazotropha weberae]MCG7903283.1 MBL fold metallo-hydrolase [Candidatus Thiodiazotropha weberae]MCG7912447.1 MBL fold metallo-hydrolase [Candidatus Thiodiazotropha weberae]ODB83190.1 MBL fold metallo-hydrolase [Candidatus Thiodiazotropha endoloripes]ODB83556.1 MBL fold metallo-hydrolase [Candidatus Thiodiazotropha endoloripes]